MCTIYGMCQWPDVAQCSPFTNLNMDIQAPRKEHVTENYFSYFLAKTYVVGTQKNCLHETVLLSTQNKCFNWWIRK